MTTRVCFTRNKVNKLPVINTVKPSNMYRTSVIKSYTGAVCSNGYIHNSTGSKNMFVYEELASVFFTERCPLKVLEQ